MELIEYLRNMGPALIFDVGANVGDKTSFFLSTGSKVVAFEPQPDCVKLLNSKFQDNSSVIVEGVGLASSEGVLNLSLCGEANTLSTFTDEWKSGRFQGYKWESSVTVPVITLKNAIDRHGLPDFCKIDVEGYEKEVIGGLHTPVKLLCFEFTREFNCNMLECIEMLNSLGMKEFNATMGGRSDFLLDQWVDMKEIQRRVNADGQDHGDIYARC